MAVKPPSEAAPETCDALSTAPPSPEARRRLLVVGWDGADAGLVSALVERGEMPAVAGLIERGVVGRLGTLAPAVSPMLWTSIATGVGPDRHGVQLDREIDPVSGAVVPVSRASWRATPIWSILQRSGLRTLVVNWPASHPVAEDSGVVVSDAYWSGVPAPGDAWPLRSGTVAPRRLEETLADLRIHPSELALADLHAFIPDLGKLTERGDLRAAQLLGVVAEAASVHAAATWLLEHETWDFAAVWYPGLERLAHGFARYIAPVTSDVDRDESALYGQVLAAGYRFHSMMLARLIELAGDDTAVLLVSDHGIRLGARRPDAHSPAIAWHHGNGLLCAAGPGIRRDELIHGAGVLDVAPTVLTWFGVPTGADMPGRPLDAIWETPPPRKTIPTWDVADARSSPAPPDAHSREHEDALAELHALGYDERAAAVLDRAAAALARTAAGHLAITHLQGGEFAQAARTLRDVIDSDEAPPVARLYLAYCEMRLGNFAVSRELIDAAPGGDALARERSLLAAMIDIADHRVHEAVAHLRVASAMDDADPLVWCLLGAAWLRARDHDKAEAAYGRALAVDPDDLGAHFGLGLVRARQRRWDDVVACMQRVLRLDHHRPPAHHLLGVALFNLHQVERAEASFRAARELAPNWPPPQAWLRRLADGIVRPPLENAGMALRVS